MVKKNQETKQNNCSSINSKLHDFTFTFPNWIEIVIYTTLNEKKIENVFLKVYSHLNDKDIIEHPHIVFLFVGQFRAKKKKKKIYF